nr:CAP domain-containing protein [Neobacillus sp. Marseille-Q6967]
MLKKKLILSTVAAAALWIANPVANKAEAANFDTTMQQKVYVYQSSNFNVNELNNLIESYLNKLGWGQHNIQVQVPETPQKQPETVEQPSQPAAPAPAPVQQQPDAEAPTTAPTAGTLSAYEQKVVELTNQERAKNGLAALKVDTVLSKMAREKSRDMSANGYFSHTSPTYGSPFDMMKQFGITYRYAGENIAMGQRSPEEVVNAWMNSEGHRKNILSPNFTHIGVGHIAEGNYWTQEFIGK